MDPALIVFDEDEVRLVEVEVEELLDLERNVPISTRTKEVTTTGKGKRSRISAKKLGAAAPGISQTSINDTDGGKGNRFSAKMDLDLLREVCASRPFEGKYKEKPAKWEQVKTDLNFLWVESISVWGIRRRFTLLLQKFKTNDRLSLQSSGTNEEYDEKIQLLTDINEFMESEQVSSKLEQERKEQQAEAVRKAALEGMSTSSSDSNTEEESIRKRRGSDQLTLAFKEKNSQEFQIKEKELAFKRYKFEKELEQREKDRSLELRRLEALENGNQNQHVLMMSLIKKLLD